MLIKRIALPLFVGSFFIFALIFHTSMGLAEIDGETQKDAAIVFYHQGVSAKTVGEREDAFERALEIYLSRFNELKREGKINGFLYYNIGNCYFNLDQLGEAIYYYRAAMKLLPGNEMIVDNLKIALEKRKEAVDIETGWIKETLLFFHYRISTAKRIDLLIGLSIITSLLLMGVIYRQQTFLRYISGIFIAMVFCLFISLGMEYYFPVHYGVLITPAEVRKDAGSGFASITPKPLGEGSGIHVLTLDNGWYKVKLNDGRKGYVQQQHLKLVI